MKPYFVLMILMMNWLQSCKTDNIDNYELKVLDEIFDDLIERMGATNYWIPPPPPPMPPRILDNLDIVEDTTEYQKIIDAYEKETEKLKSDTTTIVIAVSDSLFSCYKNEYAERNYQFTEQGYLEALAAMADSSITSHPLDLSKIKKRERIALRYASEFPEGKKIWNEKYNFFFSGVLDISRIYFDSSLQFGLIYCSFMCGRLCGEGVIVCIRKIDDKWTSSNAKFITSFPSFSLDCYDYNASIITDISNLLIKPLEGLFDGGIFCPDDTAYFYILFAVIPFVYYAALTCSCSYIVKRLARKKDYPIKKTRYNDPI